MVKRTWNNSEIKTVFQDWISEVKMDLRKRGNFWTPTLVTAPCHARTVVLRALDFTNSHNAWSLHFTIHTDLRSEKWEQLKQYPVSSLHFYCGKRKWQMRIQTNASLCHQDPVATAEWERLSPGSQQIYALKHTPGMAVDNPEKAYSFDPAGSAFHNFGVILLEATSMESLQLERPDRTDYHVRARWDLISGRAEFLAP